MWPDNRNFLILAHRYLLFSLAGAYLSITHGKGICMESRDIIEAYKYKEADQLSRQKVFDPFTGRLARDIRNTLAVDFVRGLRKMDPRIYKEAAIQWQTLPLSSTFLEYIRDRIDQYDRVYHHIRSRRIEDAMHQAVVIWNAGLFFECHDHLEEIWHPAEGELRPALKGFIQAAGFYIHMEAGNRGAARKIGAKAVVLLEKHGDALHGIANLDTLIENLKRFEPEILVLEQR
jgi:uncharacterized protein